MKLIVLCSTAVCLLSHVVNAQTPGTVLTGQDGVPRMVRSESGDWSVPIKVYSDTKQIVYVPDITQPGWAQWHAQTFKDKGTYFTYIYTYLRKEQVTVQETLYVNIHTHKALLVRFLKTPLMIDLQKASPTIVATTASVTKIVERTIESYRGPNLNEALRDQKALALHNLEVMQQNEQDARNTVAPPHEQVPAPIVRQSPPSK